MKTLKPVTLNRKIRRWQELAMRRFYALNQRDFLLVATPGGGKTFVAFMLAYEMLLDGRIERIVVVTPTEHLKKQWAEDAALLGIDLDFNWANSSGRESADFFGVAVTFHQVSFAPDLYDLNCRKKTLVIFDEIHHAGDNLDWGVKLRQAFSNAEYRILLLGTPFRSDDNPIPFVGYVENKSQADFTYGYGEALAEGVCRPIYFPTVEGNVAWIRPNGNEMECSMLDDLSRQKAGERLRTALDADGEWMPEVLRKADSLLTKMRLEGHSDAAGLVIALDQFHARKIAKLLQVITNETATIAISDEDDSSREIQKFGKKGNRRRWIVAVKMVSEGVDIPRLRVGVFATTILSELFFRQAVGRFVRMIPNLEEQSAALFLPFDERLVKHALSIKDERDHVLTEKIKTDDKNHQNTTDVMPPNQNPNELQTNKSETADFESSNTESIENVEFDSSFESQHGNPNEDQTVGENVGQGQNRRFIIPLSSNARMFETVFNGDRFTDDELNRAEVISQQIGMRVPPAQVAALIKLVSPQFSNQPANYQIFQTSQSGNIVTNTEKETTSLLSERKQKLRKEINTMANRLANLRQIKPEEVHRKWIIEQNGSNNDQATELELGQKYDWIKADIIRIQQNRREKYKF